MMIMDILLQSNPMEKFYSVVSIAQFGSDDSWKFSCNYDFCIARFNSDGTLDTTFGSNGIVIQPIGSRDDFGISLAIQPDGKILLGGYCGYNFCIARFSSNGTLDTSFGTKR
jgi:uncharacterized delta-60 repeat protein